MRLVLAALMIMHGIAHLVGFAASWQLKPAEPPYKTTVLAGYLDLGSAGIRVAGLLWLAAAIAFVVVGAGAVLEYDWWMKGALYVAVASLALTILEWPEARVGLFVNLAILSALFVVTRAPA